MYYLHSASRVTYQSLAMPLKGRYTPADRPRNELEGTRGGGGGNGADTAVGPIPLYILILLFTEAVPPGSAFYIPEERHAEVLEAS